MIPILLDEERDSFKSRNLFSNGLRMWTLKELIEFSKSDPEGFRVLRKKERSPSGIYIEWGTVQNERLTHGEFYELAKDESGRFNWFSKGFRSDQLLSSTELDKWYFIYNSGFFAQRTLSQTDCYQATYINFYDLDLIGGNAELLSWWFTPD